jgi:diacylglycerol O-acyltransferase / wax synthase
MHEERRLTGIEALFLRMDRGSAYNHTLKIVILDPSSDPDGWSFERYRVLLEHYLSVVPMLRQRYLRTPFGLHRPVWVDDRAFELDTHLRRVACPAPGGMSEFCSLVEQIYCHPLDHGRPLWQVWVVEGLEGGRVALLGLFHHAYSDGAGMRAIVEDLAASEPFDPPETAPPAPRDCDGAPGPAGWQRMLGAVREWPEVARAVHPAVRAMRARRQLERGFSAGSDSGMPSAADRRRPQPFGGRLARSRRFACESFSLAELREVRGALGGTINDVFLACVSGSVRSFLLDRGRPCESAAVGTMAFVTKPVAERSGQGGNFSSTDDVWLHPEIADPVKRLAAVSESAEVTKRHFKAVGDADPMVLVDLVPGTLIGALLRLDERTEGRCSPGCNIVVSNVPGPRGHRYVGRWRMEHWFSTGQLSHGATLNFTGWSYAGQFNLCVLAGTTRVPDAWALVNGFRASLEQLLSIARAPCVETGRGSM